LLSSTALAGSKAGSWSSSGGVSAQAGDRPAGPRAGTHEGSPAPRMRRVAALRCALRAPFQSLPGCALTEICQNGDLLAKRFHSDKLAFSSDHVPPGPNPNRELERLPPALARSETVPISER